MKKLNLFIFLALLFITNSCASNGFLMAKPEVTLFGQSYPAKAEHEKIDIFYTNKPTINYIEFAKITCGDTNDKWSIEQISKKAREIGADAIIIVGNAGNYGVGVPIGNSSYVVNESYGITAVAIKYQK